MRRLIPLGICLVLMWCRLLPAQGTSAPALTTSNDNAAVDKPTEASKNASTGTTADVSTDHKSPGVEEMKPPVYYVLDKDGKLVPMFGFQFEDFMRAFRQQQGLDRRSVPPRFVIEEMSALGKIAKDGKATAKTVALSIRFSIRLQEKGTVRVPLGLGAAILKKTGLKETAEKQSDAENETLAPSRQLLEHDPNDGYVVWVDGEPDESHIITLEVLVPLTTVGDETRLRLQSPRATKSELRLTVARANLLGQVSQRATLDTNSVDDGKATEFVARGLIGDFELSWHDSDVSTTRTPTVLTSAGRILARIDEHSVNTEATLEVRGHGSPFDRFRVRLPQGAELLASGPAGITVVEVTNAQTKSPKAAKPVKPVKPAKPVKDADKKTKNHNNGKTPTSDASLKSRVVEIRLRKKTLGPVKIRLATRQSHAQGNSGQLVELCGFEVLGAARQWGHIALAVADDIHVSWDQQSRVRQVDDLPDALRHEDVVAGFAYSSQPCSLKAWIVPRKTRLSVEPEYVVFVDGKDLRLDATLRYTVRGKKVFLLEVDLADWQLDDVGPATAVAGDGLDVDKSNKLRIPLLRRLAGKFEVTIKAHRSLPPDTKTLKVRLPTPLAASSSSAALVIQPADNVELIPNDETSVELTRQQVSAAKSAPDGYQQRPLFYRGEASKAVFVGERSIHARKVSVDVESRVKMERRTCQVYQRFSYHIDYQPLRFLEIDVPRRVAGRSDLQFELAGKKVVASPKAAKLGRKVPPDFVPMSIPLPSPGQIGSVELTIRYPLHWKELPPRASILREIQLAMPRDGKLVGNRLSATSVAPLTVGMHDEAWTQESSLELSMSQGSSLNLSTPKVNGKAVLAVHCEQRSEQKSTVVTKAWICTDLTAKSRQDWAAFEVLTGQSDLDIFLPEGVGPDQAEILLDGKVVRPKEASNNHLRLSLPSETGGQYLIELRYHCPGNRPTKGHMDLDLPRVGKDTWNRRLYWELILPQDEHVVFNPKGFVCEYTWGWNGFFWGQQPICKRDYPADWMGVSRKIPSSSAELPGQPGRHGTNRYVFSMLGEPLQCKFRTIGRSWIVLLASLGALLAGLVLIYVPRSRHPLSLLAAGIGLVIVGLIFPASTLLLLQASALGLALALMAGLLERSLARRRHATTILATGGLGAGSSILDKDSTQTQHIVPPAQPDSTDSGRNHIADGSGSNATAQMPQDQAWHDQASQLQTPQDPTTSGASGPKPPSPPESGTGSTSGFTQL